jgi:pimeloyl-ACP methyl ester carboxylesterase
MAHFRYRSMNIILYITLIPFYFFNISHSSPITLGNFSVSVTTAEIVDTSRQDPFAPTPQPRALMVSVFHPIIGGHCNSTSTPYMPVITATYEDAKYSSFGVPDGTFRNLALELCPPTDFPRNLQNCPPILFSGALGTSRYLYSALAATVASKGYVVVTVDHPYDTDIVEFPSGAAVLGLNLSDAQIPLAVETRAKDLSFVLDQLHYPKLPTHLKGGYAAAFAHSLGGAAVIALLDIDNRVVGGVNLDGSVFGPSVETDTEKVVLLFGHDGKNQSTDATWAALWPHLKGWKRELELMGSAHYTFSDFPLIADKLGGVNLLPPVVQGLIGSIGGERVMDILGAFVVNFLDMILRGGSGSLFKGTDRAFPEVKVAE